MRLCRLTKKHCHRSSGKAEAQRRSILRLEPDYTGQVYVCPACGFWHVGRRPENYKKGVA